MIKRLLYGFIALLLVIGFSFYEVYTYKRIAYIDTQVVYDQFLLRKDSEKDFKIVVNNHKRFLDSLLFDIELAQKKSIPVSVLEWKKENYLRNRQEIEEVESELNKKLINKTWTQINQYVKDYGLLNNYDFIFGANGNGNIMYASDASNITDKVVEFINNRYLGK